VGIDISLKEGQEFTQLLDFIRDIYVKAVRERNKARFRKPVLPGDQVRLVLTVLKQRRAIWNFKGEAFVEGTLVADAELMATIMDK